MRDPLTDQPLPKPGKVAIHQYVIDELARSFPDEEISQFIIRGLEERRELGVRKYHRVLQSHNGRSAWKDCWEEVLDSLVYATQLELEESHAADIRSSLMYVLRRLARMKLGPGA